MFKWRKRHHGVASRDTRDNLLFVMSQQIYAKLPAPTLADFEALAQQAFDALPEMFRSRCDRLIVRVADFADPETLAELGLKDPFELTGLYRGVALTERSVSDPVVEPEEVWLFRRAILDEWADRGDVRLGELVGHILVHEIAHHFGLSDTEIAKIDRWWE